MTARKLGRRTLLRGAGGVAIALPWLEAMQPRRARADPAAPPRRFVTFFSACGTVPGAWLPGAGFALGPILAPLQAHKPKLLVCSGIDMASSGGDKKGHNRGVGCLLTGREPLGGNDGDSGYADGISLDQFLGQQIGGDTAFSTLEFGVRTTSTLPRGRMSYLGSNQPVPPENNPYAMFDRIFGQFDPEDPAVLKRRAEQLTILDAITEEYEALDGKLGAADRIKLDAHLTAIREIEERLADLGGLGESCVPPTLAPGLPWNDNERFPEVGEIQLDLLAMALACDRTRIATFMWSTALSGIVHTWLGHTLDHHSWSHTAGAEANEMLTQINTWFAERFAGLLDRLDAVVEGDGTLLDNTVVLWGSELGRGQPHYCTQIPFVLAGGCGGYFGTGRHVAFDHASHNDLLITIAHAMGVEIDEFGDPAFCSGPLAELT